MMPYLSFYSIKLHNGQCLKILLGKWIKMLRPLKYNSWFDSYKVVALLLFYYIQENPLRNLEVNLL